MVWLFADSWAWVYMASETPVLAGYMKTIYCKVCNYRYYKHVYSIIYGVTAAVYMYGYYRFVYTHDIPCMLQF